MYTNQQKKGFTLIELLVVIAIIAVLLAILMPSLKKAKKAGKRIHCLSNVKTLSTGYMMYLQSNDGKLPGSGSNKNSWVNKSNNNPKKQINAIRNGLLYPYINTIEAYRCPVANKNEFRTYSISIAMNWTRTSEPISHEGKVANGKFIRKINQVRNTSSRMLFLCDYAMRKNAAWLVPVTADYWWNSTPIRHGSGGNVFSFADGHAEFHDWKDQRTIKLVGGKSRDAKGREGNARGEQADNEDLIWAAKAQWGKIRR